MEAQKLDGRFLGRPGVLSAAMPLAIGKGCRAVVASSSRFLAQQPFCQLLRVIYASITDAVLTPHSN